MITELKSFLWRWALVTVAPVEAKRLLAGLASARASVLEQPYTPGEISDWGRLLRSEFGQKLDLTMCNWCTQRAWQATQCPPGEIERAAGFALGAKVAWETAKSISRLGEAHSSETESGASTAAQDLAHFSP